MCIRDREGVEKGNEEAGRIIAEANAQKDTILKDAEAEAKRIVAAAEKQAAELKKNTEAELKLFATQSVEALKSCLLYTSIRNVEEGYGYFVEEGAVSRYVWIVDYSKYTLNISNLHVSDNSDPCRLDMFKVYLL